jgi:hypothetical protein
MEILEKQKNGFVDEKLMRLGKPILAISAAQETYEKSKITFIAKESDQLSVNRITDRHGTNCRKIINTPIRLYNAYDNKNKQDIKLE